MRIDVHNHFYPQAYLDEVARLGGVVRLEEEKGGRRVFTIRGVPVVGGNIGRKPVMRIAPDPLVLHEM